MSAHDELDDEDLALEDLELDDLDDEAALVLGEGPDAEFSLRAEEHEIVPLDEDAAAEL